MLKRLESFCDFSKIWIFKIHISHLSSALGNHQFYWIFGLRRIVYCAIFSLLSELNIFGMYIFEPMSFLRCVRAHFVYKFDKNFTLELKIGIPKLQKHTLLNSWPSIAKGKTQQKSKSCLLKAKNIVL